MSSNKQSNNDLKIKKSESELVINKKWFSIKRALFCGSAILYFALAFKLFFSFNIISENHYMLIGTFVLSGSLLSYLLVAGWMNGSRIVVDQYNLEIERWPIPFMGNIKIPAEEISYLYIRNNIDHDSESSNVDYEVHALTLGGRDMKLTDGLSNPSQAGKIKKNIANFLRIADIPSLTHKLNPCQQ